jgi:hypothetical protein
VLTLPYPWALTTTSRPISSRTSLGHGRMTFTYLLQNAAYIRPIEVDRSQIIDREWRGRRSCMFTSNPAQFPMPALTVRSILVVGKRWRYNLE